MANFLVIVDPQDKRRRQFIHKAEKYIAPYPNLVVDTCTCGDMAAVSARGRGTPFTRSCANDSAGWIFGDAIQHDDTKVSAEELRERWPAKAQGAFDGYFAGFVYVADRGLTVGCDVLGTFPVYYFQQGNVLLVGSSAELFRLHPCFTPRISPRGLAGILLTNGLVQNQAFLQEVRRLEAGRLLHWPGSGPIQEIPNRLPQPSDRYLHCSERDLLEAADEAFERILRRHAPGKPAALMLSGGLDSRIVAGYLHRLGHSPTVLTFGRPDDLEVQAGRQVARILDWPFHNGESQMTLRAAIRGAKWEHLAGGFSALGAWEEGQMAGELAPQFWSGYSLDQLLGGTSLTPSFDPKTKTYTWEKIYQRIIHWGLPPDSLARLLAPIGGKSLIGDVVDGLWQSLRCFVGKDHQQIIQARLTTRMRFHQGIVVWRTSFGSWPILPWLDRRFIETILDLPAWALLRRRLEKKLLQTRFPELARIPLDTNSWRFTPLLPGRKSLWLRASHSIPFVHRWQVGWRPWNLGVERRRYHRMFDLNGTEWHAVRSYAEPFRGRLAQWCQPDELDRLLPSSDYRCFSKNPFSEDSSRRNLLGFMLWAGEHA